MAYIKNTWVDQDVERPKTYEVTNNQDGSITLTDSFGLVQELGTPVNAVNMNHIEDGIDGCAIRKHNLTETFALGEWVLGGTGDDEGFYKSLIANNVGNAVTDDTKWEKVTDLNAKADTDLTNITDSAKVLMSGMGMPSDKYIDLTLGASGSTYTVPANGWFLFRGISTANVQFSNTVVLDKNNNLLYVLTSQPNNIGYNAEILTPVSRGNKVQFNYNVKAESLRFIYAEGAQ